LRCVALHTNLDELLWVATNRHAFLSGHPMSWVGLDTWMTQMVTLDWLPRSICFFFWVLFRG
jgi:hypothetical protein